MKYMIIILAILINSCTTIPEKKDNVFKEYHNENVGKNNKR